MNKIIKSLAAAFVGSALITSSALAFPNPDGAQPDHESWQPPQPTEIVSPLFASAHDGSTVKVKVTIDEVGNPSDVKVLAPHDPQLKRQVVKAVEQWKFSPAMRDGKAVKVRAIMPIELKLDRNS